jgi:sulfate permease, SulP family
VVIFDCQSMNFIDSQGASKLIDIAEYLHANGVSFRMARVKPRVIEVLERDGLVQRIGPANFHLDVDEAAEAHLAQLRPKPT